MPRPVKQMHGRFVRPEIFKDPDLIQLELETQQLALVRLVLIGVWEYADSMGRFAWNPFRMHMEVMPHMPLAQFTEILNALHAGRWLCRYTADGKEYGHVRTWLEYQRTHYREADSGCPICTACDRDMEQEKWKESLAEQSKGRKGKKRGERGSEKVKEKRVREDRTVEEPEEDLRPGKQDCPRCHGRGQVVTGISKTGPCECLTDEQRTLFLKWGFVPVTSA